MMWAMNREHPNFVQTMTFRSDQLDRLLELGAQWDRQQAAGDIMGYVGMRVLADRDDPGRYIMVAEFGMVDPDVSAFEEAQRNNDRPETQAAAQGLMDLAVGEIEWHHYDEVYRTDPFTPGLGRFGS
jgi:hypothetical protein